MQFITSCKKKKSMVSNP